MFIIIASKGDKVMVKQFTIKVFAEAAAQVYINAGYNVEVKQCN